jgi:galactonate dehydratase
VKIATIECLSAHAGWRIHDFVKVTIADGLAGWSEFSRAVHGPGVPEAISAIAHGLIDQDPRSPHVRTTLLESGRSSSIAYQACSALRNALLDVRARALGVPVYELLGGRVRDRVRVYWAHCGTYRASHAEVMERPAVRTLDDLVDLGREVAERAFTALKTNLLLFSSDGAKRYAPRSSRDGAALTTSPRLERALVDQLHALRSGAGPEVDILVDLGSNFRTDAAVRMSRAIESFGPGWLELELRDVGALRFIREHTRVPLAAGERLSMTEYLSLLRDYPVDIPIVDVLFNSVDTALHVAAAADAHDLNIAVHNCYSPLATWPPHSAPARRTCTCWSSTWMACRGRTTSSPVRRWSRMVTWKFRLDLGGARRSTKPRCARTLRHESHARHNAGAQYPGRNATRSRST